MHRSAVFGHTYTISFSAAYCNGCQKGGALQYMTSKKKKLYEQDNSGWVCVKEYTNRWGKRMVAKEYGYNCWKFIVKNKHN